MADYYLDPDSGSDLNDGTSGTPFKTLGRVNATSFSAGDNIYFSGGSESNPLRGEFRASSSGSAGSEIVYHGNSAVVTGSINLTEGEEYEYIDSNYNTRSGTDRNLWLNSFTANAPDTWTNLGTAGVDVFENTSVQLSGMAACLELDSATSTPTVHQQFLLPNGPIKLHIMYKSQTSGAILAVRLRSDAANGGDGYYADISDDGTFNGYSSSLKTANLPASTSAFTVWESGWISRDYAETTPNRLFLLGGGTSSSYIQNVGFTIKTEWETHDAANKVYKIKVSQGDSRTVVMMKGTRASWAASGFAGLDYMKTADSLASIQAGSAAGKCWMDNSNNYVYIQLESGETLSDVHLEMVGYAFSSGYIDSAISYVNLKDLKFRGGYNAGLDLDGDNCTLYNVECNYNRGTGLANSGAGNVGYSINASYNGRLFPDDGVYSTRPLSSNGILSAGGDLTVYGGYAIKNGDEGIQNNSGGTLNCYGVVAHSNWSAQARISGGNWVARQCTLARGDESEGWTDQEVLIDRGDLDTNDASYTREITECYIRGDTAPAVKILLDSETPSNITASNNIVIGTITDSTVNQEFTNQTGLVTSDSGGFTSYPNDLTPASDSVAVGAGTKWWGTSARPVSASGEPYPDVNLDKGGIQTTHDAMHPKNN